MKNLKWLDARTVRAIHLELLAEHGGLSGVRNEGLLESALARPRSLIASGTPSLHRLAASYGFSLAKNLPFLDGNKRIALVSIGVFLDLNKYEFVASQTDVVNTILVLAAGGLKEQELATWVKSNMQLRLP